MLSSVTDSAILTSQTEAYASSSSAAGSRTQRGSRQSDSAEFSSEALNLTDFSSPVWSVNGNASFTMSGYTAQGTLVTLSMGTQGNGSFTMGKFSRQNSMFRLSGQDTAEELRITFEDSSGKTQSYVLDGNARFVETENGEIMKDDSGLLSKRADGTDNNMIVVNLEDDAVINGGTGDDVLFNLGQNAALNGGDGNDTIMSMGDGASLQGGNGNDLLKVVRDVLRREDVSEGLGMDKARAGLVGFEEGQSVSMDGGAGNDIIQSDVKLHDSQINGGDGDDVLDFDTLVDSRLDMGVGNDRISADVLYGTTLSGGDGDDSFSIGTASHSSSIDGGPGQRFLLRFKA